VPFDYLFTYRQTYSGTGELVTLVQPLEHTEDLFKVLWFDPEPIVLY
jgi:hypothetical protein